MDLAEFTARVSRDWPAITVLYYHQVSDRPHALIPPELVCPLNRFRREMVWIKENFRVVSLPRALAEAAQGGPWEHLMVVTFDDGLEGVARTAWPVLTELGIPSTVFVNTRGLMGKLSWILMAHYLLTHGTDYDLQRAAGGPVTRGEFIGRIKENFSLETMARLEEVFGARAVGLAWPYITRERLETRDASLVSLGSHGHSHVILSKLDRRGQSQDLDLAHETLKEMEGYLGMTSLPFGYHGSWDYFTEAWLKARGRGYLITAYGGLNWRGAKAARGLREVRRIESAGHLAALPALLWQGWSRQRGLMAAAKRYLWRVAGVKT
ncbi:MAG: polysaccharide deacetylase family protein [Deltaproteobacteria bacterium]|nr:polysaccharide deacetylase family protein [Deltaproteobacteria bacterium]